MDTKIPHSCLWCSSRLAMTLSLLHQVSFHKEIPVLHTQRKAQRCTTWNATWCLSRKNSKQPENFNKRLQTFTICAYRTFMTQIKLNRPKHSGDLRKTAAVTNAHLLVTNDKSANGHGCGGSTFACSAVKHNCWPIFICIDFLETDKHWHDIIEELKRTESFLLNDEAHRHRGRGHKFVVFCILQTSTGRSTSSPQLQSTCLANM